MGEPRRGWIVVAACLALSACATSSGVVPVGPGIYSVGASAGGFGLAADAQRQAYSDARAYCAAHGGGNMEIVQQGTDSNFNGANTNVTFRCVAP